MYPTLSLLLSPPITLKILLEEAIANIDPNKLMNSCSMSTYNHKILEKAWQDEILRAVDDCLPKDIDIHSTRFQPGNNIFDVIFDVIII